MKNQSPSSFLDNFSASLLQHRRHGLDKRIVAIIIFIFFIVVQAVWEWRSGQLNQLMILLITYSGAFYFYYQRRDKLKFPENALAQGFACVLLGACILKFLTLARGDFTAYVALFSFIGLVSCTLFVSGFYGIKQFWRLLLLVLFLQSLFKLLTGVIEASIPLSLISAKVSAYGLWYLGFDVVQSSTFVYVNGGIIDVHDPCTAFPLYWSSIQLIIIAYVFLPVRFNKYSVPVDFICCFIVTFLLSIIRLGVMALVVNDPAQFQFWHGTSGSNLFTLPSFLFCGFLILWRIPNSSNKARANLISKGRNHAPIQSSWLFRILAILFISGLMLLVLSNQGQRTISAYTMPRDIPLNQWHWQNSQSLDSSELSAMANVMQSNNNTQAITPKELEEQQEQQYASHIPLAGQRYTYERGLSRLMMTLVYVINTNAKTPFLGNGYITQDVHRRELRGLDRLWDKGNKSHLVVTDNGNTHLLGCLTPRGETVIRPYIVPRFNRIRDTLLKPRAFYGWLVGDRPIWDHRCLWVHLRMDGQTPETKNQLVAIWQELIDYWQIHFPPL